MSDLDALCNTTILVPFNQTIYDNCCPPELNTDVGGIGVRISFYLQALFLACLSARSGSLDEITGSLYTLVATNVAMAVTAFILGFKDNSEITLQDAIVVLYLLTLSWAAVFFSLPSYNRFRKSDRTLKYLSIVQSYILFGFAFAVLVKANGLFGSTPICNSGARVAVFRPFNILPVGRILALVGMSIVIGIYTMLTAIDYYPLVVRQINNWRASWAHWRAGRQKRREEKAEWKKKNSAQSAQNSGSVPRGFSASRRNTMPADGASTTTGRTGAHKTEKSKSHGHRGGNDGHQTAYDLGISGNIIIENLVIFILWGMAVMNTELLIRWNRFKDSGESQWQFGQILPVFLVVLPLINMIKAFKKYGFSRRVHRRKMHKNRTHKSSGRHHNGGGGLGGRGGDAMFDGLSDDGLSEMFGGMGGMSGLGGGFGGGGGLGGLGGGMGGGMPFFGGGGGMFGGARQNQLGNMQTAHISEVSIRDEGQRSTNDNNQIGSDDVGDLYVQEDNNGNAHEYV